MSNRITNIGTRAEELLVDQAVAGLSVNQQDELEKLLKGDADRLQAELMETAALVQLGMLEREPGAKRAMPAALRRKINAEAAARFQPAEKQANVVSIKAARSVDAAGTGNNGPAAAYLGWAAAAALAVALVVVGTDRPSIEDSAAAQRSQLLSSATDLVKVEWAQSDDPLFAGVRGDVVWSDTLQAGYMRLSGLPSNDSARQQYQLWIVAPERSEQPVDGGVFDIPAGSAEVIIPIDAKLPVSSPAAFAITLEKPGGVVVSAGPLLVVAPVRG